MKVVSHDKLLIDGLVPEVPQRPGTEPAAGGAGDEPDVDAGRRQDRRATIGAAIQKDLAGEAADELPELPPVTVASRGRRSAGRFATTAWTSQSYCRSLERLADTPEFRAFATNGVPRLRQRLRIDSARPSRSTTTRPRPRSTAGSSSRSPPRRSGSPASPAAAARTSQILPVLRDPGRADRPHRPRQADVLRDEHPAARRRAAGAGREPRRPADEDRGQPASTPRSRGSTDAFAQASHPRPLQPRPRDVGQVPRRDGRRRRRARGTTSTASPAREAERLREGARAKGFYVLAEQMPSPALRLIREHVKEKLPEGVVAHLRAGRHDRGARRARRSPSGRSSSRSYRLRQGRPHPRARQRLPRHATRTRLHTAAGSPPGGRSRSRRHDEPAVRRRIDVHRHRHDGGPPAAARRRRRSAAFLVAVARELKSATRAAEDADATSRHRSPARSPELAEKWVKAVAKDLAEHAGKGVVVVGPRQPAWVHALAHAVNDALGQLRRRAMAEFRDPPPEAAREGHRRTGRGHGGGQGEHAAGHRRQPGVQRPGRPELRGRAAEGRDARCGSACSTTTRPRRATGTCRSRTPLESWGDTEPRDGTLCCVQPLIAPLNSAKSAGGADIEPPPRGGRTAARSAGAPTQFPNPADGKPVDDRTSRRRRPLTSSCARSFAERSGIATDARSSTPSSTATSNSASSPPTRTRPAAVAEAAGRRSSKPTPRSRRRSHAQPAPAPTKDALEVTFHPDYSVFDGRFAMNPWLQELPDPITKLVWDNAAIISPETAAEFG